MQNADGGAGWHAEWQATPIRRGRVAAGCVCVCDPTTPQTPSNSAVSWNVDACTILRQPSFGDPRGLDRLDRSGIP